MTKRSRRLAAAAAAAGVAFSPAVAAAPASTGDHGRGHHHHHGSPYGSALARDITDADFLAKAARANRFEVVTGQLAQQRAGSTAVKELGAMFVTDHSKALADGAAVAAKLGIPVPQDLSRAQQAQVDQLSQLSGARFDRVWLRYQIAAHVKALNLHLRGALWGDTQDVRDLAIAGVPVVTKHLSELIQLQKGSAAAGHH
jgi:putative membrane protein